ncbi:MAG: hypothetical protein KDC73_02090 [Ignavibacteriae bacterium]|nr:hypothetical protein [Ignavibacteriota bacterium]MCB9243312.1 hypothetical protein [Ignavibacteriales bacterium]
MLGDTYRRVKQLPFIKDNPPVANLILVLGIFAYILIFVDFHTEMARDKDEISSVIGVLENTNQVVDICSLSLLIDLKVVSVIYDLDERIESSEPEITYLGRSPPEHPFS